MKLIVAVCAMAKKSKSKPMQKILKQLKKNGDYEIIVFSEEMILKKPIEEWPKCDALMTFFSGDFPLEKVQQYIQLTSCWSVNDMNFQNVLFDRMSIYSRLTKIGVKTPKYLVINTKDSKELIEKENYIEYKDKRIYKPFVEKPVSSEDHNIWIYHSKEQGGGSTKLFRKSERSANCERSSERSKNSQIRKNGTYLYEEFINPENLFDIKVYAVGENYAYAEKRRVPFAQEFLDVNTKNQHRQKVELTDLEREYARKIVQTFHQNVCGFDILRDHKGRSYVIDINGWSLVNSSISDEYFQKCGQILNDLFIQNCSKIENQNKKSKKRKIPFEQNIYV
ncbi:inositol hexakisphosphate and diphosphoinositol-pentakisphosphate kinase [Anaeramoeba ignava]|uniref:Inositol hexakisphosphate and diphosphoinositol-pentakisphosphate kinase n=1 Tax=Anaeramoeba ignava TaxID=1746090 RepID=A0A9Q0L9A8_ANAIG|nr:inositol hexakisphosphate and diphosphoinositol-pentakisphosphate kinase [Anaeramoeba ignava]|eukprot:Anaeramoba_ignava/a483981_125.p1 GENE.a483981_125~~a483981_125.p1  ORF type:complete len:337 (-),score=98.08 a483981_125:191-1201(-)